MALMSTLDTQTTELPEVADPSGVAPKDARELSRLFFEQLAVLEEGTPEYSYARNTLIEMNMSLVRYAAGRFRSRGPEEMEDIVQVGMIGLIKAIDRFELSREVEFTSFAIPYVVGRSSGSSATPPGPCTFPGGCRRPASSSPGPRKNCEAGWAARRRSRNCRS